MEPFLLKYSKQTLLKSWLRLKKWKNNSQPVNKKQTSHNFAIQKEKDQALLQVYQGKVENHPTYSDFMHYLIIYMFASICLKSIC